MKKYWDTPSNARAAAVLAPIMASGGRYSSYEMWQEMRKAGVYVAYSSARMSDVRKFMRHELGLDVVTEHAREHSVCWLRPTPAEAEKDANYRIHTWYSEAVTMFISMAGFPNLQLQAQIMALTLGQQLGLSRAQIDADLGLPPPPPPAASATPVASSPNGTP